MELESLALRQVAPATHPALDVEALAQLDSVALETLFRSARYSGNDAVAGHPRGRMLAVPGFDRGFVARLLAAFARSPFQAWEGKSFRTSDQRGTNRVRLFGLRFTLFRFRTYAVQSRVDGLPALAIDYDVPDNPAYARSTYDELRHVGPGLFLGRGMKRTDGGGIKLLVWFALDMRQQDGALAF
jgi:hypothetical protein